MTEVVPPAPEEKVDFESMSKETLITMINEKVKEITSLKGRNSKLESKYISVFKEHKLYKKDHEVSSAFLKMVFSSMPQVALGGLQIKDLQVMWATRQADFNEKMRKLMQELMEDRKKEEAQQRKSVEQKLSHMDQQSRNLNVQLQKRLADTEKNLEKMAAEVVRLQNILSIKEQENKTLLSDKVRLEHDLNSIRVDSVQNELESSFSMFIDTPKENVEKTELLIVKQQLEKVIESNETLKETVSALQAKIRGKNRQIELLKVNQESAGPAMIPTSNHTSKLSSSNGSLATTKRKSEQQKRQEPSTNNSTMKDQQLFESFEMPPDRNKDYIERQYLKNVFLRFMKCLNEQNYPQAEILESVLMTIMGMNYKERQLATFRRKQWWNIFS